MQTIHDKGLNRIKEKVKTGSLPSILNTQGHRQLFCHTGTLSGNTILITGGGSGIGRPCGIKCTVRDYSEVIEKALDELGIAQKTGMEQKPEMELKLFPGKPIHQEDSKFESGVTTHSYRQYRLEKIESENGQER